jgi:LacI family transcriptional regulator
MDETKNITMEDIARRLDISVSTVSRSFTRSDLVNPETRRRVKDICSKLNYRPNLNARAIATRKTNVIGLVARNISLIYEFETFACNLENTLHKNGYSLQIELGHSNPAREVSIVENMLDRLVDGIIVCSRSYEGKIEAIEMLSRTNVPFVVLGYYHDQKISQVVEDYLAGGRAITEHFINLGHRKIAMITYQQGDPRINGYRLTHKENNIELDESLIYRISPQMTELEDVIADILSRKATALFAMHDEMASIVYRICRRRNINIPNDISVASTGHMQNTDLWGPPLTVYRLGQDNFGEIIGTILLDKIADKDSPTRIVHFGGHMIVRGSTMALQNE